MKLQRHTVSLLFALTCVGVFTAGCGSDSVTDPAVTALAGTYVVTEFTTTENEVITNQLDLGANATLVLMADGATSGHVFVPADGEDGPLDADLSGTWRLDGSTVTLSHGADTFLRDMPLTVVGNTLVGDQTILDTRVQITFTRQ